MSDLVFGKYEVLRRLAVGGMGEVFLARQTGIGGFERLVILKSLLPHLAAREGFVNQFLEEARVAATLNHPNLVQIFEVGKWEGAYFIAMEYIAGTNLVTMRRHAHRRKASIPLPVILRIMHDAAAGLDHAHTASDVDGRSLAVVHRDISPENVMVRLDGVTKVVDFGIAKSANRASYTRTGQLKGKLPYMSPEQVAGRPLDGRSDQFSLGVVFWELCAGRALFDAGSEVDLLRVVQEARVPLLSQEAPGLPPELDPILQRMLAREAEDRYPTLAQVAADLSRFLERISRGGGEVEVASYLKQLGLDAEVQATRTPAPSGENFIINLRSDLPSSDTRAETVADRPPPKKVGTRPRRLLYGAALLTLLVLAGGSWAFMRTPSGAPPPRLPEPSPAQPLEAAAPPEAEAPARGPRLVVRSVPEGGSVVLDGAPRGPTPVELEDLAPGVAYTLRVERRGFAPREMEITLAEEELRQVEVVLERRPKRPRPSAPQPAVAPVANTAEADGYLTLNTRPWTKVSIDGQPAGTTPIFKRRLRPGSHRLELVNEAAGVRKSFQVEIVSGENTKLDLDLP